MPTYNVFKPVPGKFLGIISQDPSDSKSSQLHVDIFLFCFTQFEVYFVYSSKMIGNSPEASNFNRLHPKLLNINPHNVTHTLSNIPKP